MARAQGRLIAIKLLHTVVWAFFGGCVVLIPMAAWRGRLDLAALFIGLVAVEVAILALNRMRCPLTDVAAQYTSERHDNFDIYLPLTLARYNKEIFGTLYVVGIVMTVVRWLG
jgi:hypothetical protein